MKPRLLDLFCGAGGAAVGYHRAGFDVVGVDIRPQPRYPFEFHRGDALEFLAEHGHEFDAIHASPPCHDFTSLVAVSGTNGTADLLPATRCALAAYPAWVIENVRGAPMRADYRLCGCQFGLPGLRRERWFETSWHGFDLRSPCHHRDPAVNVSGHGSQGWQYKAGTTHSQAARQTAMGIDWMNRDELAQAIPPAFAEYIGLQLIAHLNEQAA